MKVNGFRYASNHAGALVSPFLTTTFNYLQCKFSVTEATEVTGNKASSSANKLAQPGVPSSALTPYWNVTSLSFVMFPTNCDTLLPIISALCLKYLRKKKVAQCTSTLETENNE